jgi:hypothetical protein
MLGTHAHGAHVAAQVGTHFGVLHDLCQPQNQIHCRADLITHLQKEVIYSGGLGVPIDHVILIALMTGHAFW